MVESMFVQEDHKPSAEVAFTVAWMLKVDKVTFGPPIPVVGVTIDDISPESLRKVAPNTRAYAVRAGGEVMGLLTVRNGRFASLGFGDWSKLLAEKARPGDRMVLIPGIGLQLLANGDRFRSYVDVKDPAMEAGREYPLDDVLPGMRAAADRVLAREKELKQ